MDAPRSAPIAFAHRGARAQAPDNTVEAFVLARRLGATGLESDVWVTADGVAVLDHDGVARSGLGEQPIPEVCRRDLPAHIPSLADLYAACGSDYALSLDVKDVGAIRPVLDVAEQTGADGKLWLCHHDWRMVASWRRLSSDVLLVDSTHVRAMREGPERRAAQLADAGINAVNLHHSEWTADLTALFHHHGILAFGWDAQHDRTLDSLLEMGIDAVYSDYVDRMNGAVARFHLRAAGDAGGGGHR